MLPSRKARALVILDGAFDGNVSDLRSCAVCFARVRLAGCQPSLRSRPRASWALTAQRILLDGLARDAGIFALAGKLAPLHPRDDTSPWSASWARMSGTGA